MRDMVTLKDYQVDAVKRIKNGSILCGGVGSGKSITALAYYYIRNGGDPNSLTDGYFEPMDDRNIKDLYIITTARKRDTFEWEGELSHYLMSTKHEENLYCNKIVVDSWNNIGKYVDVADAFFIFDEQRVVGYGAWTKSFLKITAKNEWILLSATPGDTWQDYAPVFIANGFFKNITEFRREHIVYSRFQKFPKIEKYLNTGRLIRLRNNILVNMDFQRQTIAHHEDIYCNFDKFAYKNLLKTRWNPWENCPIENASELCYLLRKIVNTADARLISFMELCEKHPRVIVFYNFDYELDMLKEAAYIPGTAVAEWNGHQHQPIPKTERWVYLVQYNAGAEGWNCIMTDTIIFYSQNYSYRTTVQAAGRIDRLNTPYEDLYFYHLKSRSSIDIGISNALGKKKKFNENAWLKGA